MHNREDGVSHSADDVRIFKRRGKRSGLHESSGPPVHESHTLEVKCISFTLLVTLYLVTATFTLLCSFLTFSHSSVHTFVEEHSSKICKKEETLTKDDHMLLTDKMSINHSHWLCFHQSLIQMTLMVNQVILSCITLDNMHHFTQATMSRC